MSSDETRIFLVEGMTCGHCELSVREEVEELAGVISASADHTTGRLVVHGEVDDEAVAAAVAEAGYALTGAAADAPSREA